MGFDPSRRWGTERPMPTEKKACGLSRHLPSYTSYLKAKQTLLYHFRSHLDSIEFTKFFDMQALSPLSGNGVDMTRGLTVLIGWAQRSVSRSMGCGAIVARLGAPAAGALIGLSSYGCQVLSANAPEPTVSLRVKGNVPDAQVTVDDIPIGALGFVAAKGVALPRGKHRVTVEKAGYFAWDALVEAKSEPVFLRIDLVPIPD